ncbi:phospho-N-acetylmuramoyl-pentapeptide-transferase [Helicobacter didelphidarum]|uniref:Phospho-N-acetylmuramoyl-pentapeptide-transferase n=1 Tax=Helicobacter didelphidarum TaxID=2040648 RepID=A0A3D8IC89_9HELI|nr:phospho-N-acetylmuramoyl-pentapeptide-transferase [Helicobacter didelphidarum]RDU62690.1 phospho-N-acetylmuramoyl-pentapeptide-transferase [Helicobacter didelphidarum]
MLYELYAHGLSNVAILKYITFRAGVAFFIAFLLCVFLMPHFVAWAKAKKASQPISDSIKAHANKKDTPTMGGLVFVFSAVIASLLTAKLDNSYVHIGLACLTLFMLIGARDDYMKISAKKNAGMSSRVKFLLLACVAIFISFCLYKNGLSTDFYVPIAKNPLFELSKMPILIIAFWVLVFLSTTNAVNVTDGLDGLATIPSICVLTSLSIFVYVGGNIEIAKYLLWPHIVDSGEIMVLILAMIGALFGFLWYNCHPAQVFMGDSGSLALGGFIAFCAIISKNEILLILMGSIFVIETISVILQIGSYKLRQKRIFLMAPIHHHFEAKGWAENKIIVRFWIIAILSNIVALITLKIR